MIKKQDIKRKIQEKLRGTYDWIDTGNFGTSEGLNHLKAYKEGKKQLANENEVIVGGSTDGFTEEDYDYLETKLEEIKQELGIKGEWTGASGDFFQYSFEV